MKIKFYKPFRLTPEELEYQNKIFTLIGMSNGNFLVINDEGNTIVFTDTTNFTTEK